MQPLQSASNDNLPLTHFYLLRAEEYAKLAQSTRSLGESSRYRKMARACADLARQEDWLAGKGAMPDVPPSANVKDADGYRSPD